MFQIIKTGRISCVLKNTVHLPSSMIIDSIALVIREAEILMAYLVRSDCKD